MMNYLDLFLAHEIVSVTANIDVYIILDHVEMNSNYIDVDHPKMSNE